MDGQSTDGDERAPVSVQVLQRIGRFVLLSELGRGGMGTVFAAYDEHLERKVAIKLLHFGAKASEPHRLRVLREAQAMARVSHPNVVSIYEVGEVHGQGFIAMEYIDGQTLSVWQKQAGQTWQELLGMYLQAGRGLAAAHGTGLVHRDFKPDNVLVGKDGRARVLDFGLARIADHAESEREAVPQSPGSTTGKLTIDERISGTPGYMSPEQCRGEMLDAKTDQFSFCAALFEALYRKLPFAGETVHEIAANTITGRTQERPRDSSVPEEIHRAIMRGLSSAREQRFPSMSELLDALHLELSDTAAAAANSRRRLVRFMLITGGLTMTTAQVLRARGPMRYGYLLAVSVVMIGVISAMGLWQRKSLLRNSHHRRMWVLMLVPLLQNFVQRLIGWQMDLPIHQLAPFELVVMAGAAALGGAYFSRSLFWLSGLLLGASALWTAAGQPAGLYLAPTYVITLFWMLWVWTSLGASGQKRSQSVPPRSSPDLAQRRSSRTSDRTSG